MDYISISTQENLLHNLGDININKALLTQWDRKPYIQITEPPNHLLPGGPFNIQEGFNTSLDV